MRTQAQLRSHYLVEKELAARLRAASKQERKLLYKSLYDELYRRVPDHPQLQRKAAQNGSKELVERQMRLLDRFLRPTMTFLEIGAGDCALSLKVADAVERVIAIDVSEVISKSEGAPDNFEFILSDGCEIPLSKASVDLVYSYQLMEHLHPDDAREQLENVFSVLKSGGIYICETPSRLSGPHDISRYFDTYASGFHLKEYTTTELVDLFRGIGFKEVSAYSGLKGRYFRVPMVMIRMLESTLSEIRENWRYGLARRIPCRLLLGTPIVAIK